MAGDGQTHGPRREPDAVTIRPAAVSLLAVTDTEPTSPARALDDAELLRLYPRLRRFAAVVGPAEVEPDDLVQEALERLLARGLDDVEHIEAYVRQIILRAASNHRRRLGRSRRALDRFSRRDARSLATDDVYPSDVDFLEALPPAGRAVLYLREVEGLDVRNVATQLAMSEASVKQIARRARLTLQQRLDDGTNERLHDDEEPDR